MGAKVRKRGARSWKSATIAKRERRERRKGRRRREERKPEGASLQAGLERRDVSGKVSGERWRSSDEQVKCELQLAIVALWEGM